MTDNVYPLLMVPQDVMRSCAARVRELRIRQNITQKELAERVGVATAATCGVPESKVRTMIAEVEVSSRNLKSPPSS